MSYKIFFLFLLTTQLVVKPANVMQDDQSPIDAPMQSTIQTPSEELEEIDCEICCCPLNNGCKIQTGICDAPKHRHIYHTECIEDWLKRDSSQGRCPKCNQKFYKEPILTNVSLLKVGAGIIACCALYKSPIATIQLSLATTGAICAIGSGATSIICVDRIAVLLSSQSTNTTDKIKQLAAYLTHTTINITTTVVCANFAYKFTKAMICNYKKF